MLTVTSPALYGDLVTVARVKNELGLTTSADDAKIEDMIAEASSLLAHYCNRETFGVEQVTQIERQPFSLYAITLGRDLAPAITSVTVDGSTLDPAEYELDGALLYRLYDDERVAWSAKKVTIDYTAGFNVPDEAPPALSRAALDMVVGMYRGQGRDSAIRSEQVEGVGQVSYFDTKQGMVALSADRLAALARYRLVRVG